jgi:hypothetical protein
LIYRRISGFLDGGGPAIPDQSGHSTSMPIRPRTEDWRSRKDKPREPAEDLAVAGFAFLAADSRRLGRFLEFSGLEVAALRAATREPDFLAGVLDHICAEEEVLIAFAAEAGIAPHAVVAARDALHGHAWERDTP